ncbi:hypothetical protein [Chelativorans sp. YIM 93263]|uniref:hypothetical protein n=1 Tax=Chelativorans sp. YIM 93263 TaxID=2906648 RepID=UPI0023783F74|nr:hypothetical protein [Chelativorans sp. YIM 93263]
MAKPEKFAPAPKYGFPADAKGFLLPPVVWAGFFVAIYSVQGAGCAAIEAGYLGFGTLRLLLTALTVLTAAAILVVGIWSGLAFRRIRRENAEGDDGAVQSRFLAEGAMLSAGLFFVATLWIGLPIAWTNPCGG